MLKYQTFVSLKRMLRVENAKHFLQQHRDQIKTVALPCLVLAAVLFFWFYGNAQDSEQVHMEDAQTAAENQPTETQQAELAGSETKGAENIPEQGDASASQYRSQAQANDGKININLADAATLQMIPGIGPSKAERILEYRETTGPFQNIEDIKNVSGIGNKTFENIREYLCVS